MIFFLAALRVNEENEVKSYLKCLLDTEILSINTCSVCDLVDPSEELSCENNHFAKINLKKAISTGFDLESNLT